MILLIGKNKEVEEFIDESMFSDLGIWERTHMEEWIAEYPEILGENLLTITTEYHKFDRTDNRLDILAIDRNGKLVIIELKRDIADKFVDLQAIHYAAYCSTLNLEQVIDIMAEYCNKSKEVVEKDIREFITYEGFSDFDNQPRIMLVANDYREETIAAVLWLRDNGIDLTCVKLESYKIGDKIAIKPDIIIPLPEAKDYMMQVEEKKKTSVKFSPKLQEYKKFWDDLARDYKLVDSNFNVKNPYPQSWLWYGAGKSGLSYSWIFSENQLTLELYINGDVKQNKEIVNQLKVNKEEIEEKLGPLNWDQPKNNKTQKIRLKNGIKANIMDIDENGKLELIKWGTEYMKKFKGVFDPFIQKLE